MSSPKWVGKSAQLEFRETSSNHLGSTPANRTNRSPSSCTSESPSKEPQLGDRPPVRHRYVLVPGGANLAPTAGTALTSLIKHIPAFHLFVVEMQRQSVLMAGLAVANHQALMSRRQSKVQPLA